MLKILAVADQGSKYLEICLKKKQAAPEVDAVCACGDVPREYLDMFKIYVSEEIFYVHGDQDKSPRNISLAYPSLTGEEMLDTLHQPPGIYLHGRVVVRPRAIYCGFSGIKSSLDRAYHFREREMRRITRRVQRKLRLIRCWERLRRRPPKPVIVLSHAPPRIDESGRHSPSGFDCFRKFMLKNRPLLWLHGQDPLPSFSTIHREDFAGTAIVNAFEFKLVTIQEGQVSVDFRL